MNGIDEVPWSRLTHAHGIASDLPGLLDALARGDESARVAALDGLSDRLVHQGTIQQATAYATPFLAQLVADHRLGETRTAIARLLVGILYAQSAAAQERWQTRSRRGEPYARDLAWQAAERVERAWLLAARGGVRAGIATYRMLAQEPSASLRRAALDLLSCFPEAGPASARVLEAQASREPDPELGALEGLVAWSLDPEDALCARTLQRSAWLGDARAVNLACMVSLARGLDALPSRPHGVRWRVMLGSCATGELPWTAGLEDLAERGGWIRRHRATNIESRQPLRDSMIGALTELLSSADSQSPTQSEALLDLALWLALGASAGAERPSGPWSDVVHDLLVVLVRSETLWEGSTRATEALVAYGAPHARAALCAALGIADGGLAHGPPK